MTTCAHPRCSSPARWRCRDGQSRCSDHAVDVSPLTPLPDNTILAARCPPGWRRDPLTGRPVMPCLGRLLFPCEPSEVPDGRDILSQCGESGLDGYALALVQVLLVNAARAKQRHGECLDLVDERVVSDVVDAALREQDTVRIRRTAGGWEEVGNGI